MINGSQTTIVLLIVLTTIGFLLWSYNRTKSYGKLGILAWLQSVVLTVPWLLFFGLFTLGITINIVGILFLIIVSAGIYIYLGRRLRAEGQDAVLKERAAERIKQSQETQSASEQSSELSTEVHPIADVDLKAIQGIFGIDTFFATETIPYQEGAIFKGNLRGEPGYTHARLSQRLKEILGDKYRLFLVESPEDRPVVVVLPSSNDPQPANLAQKNLALVLWIATITTTLEAGALLQNFDLFSDFSRYQQVLPFSLGLWGTLAAHELGHRLLAQRHQIRLSLPYFIPSWQIGAFGAITRFESLIPNRNVLFDIAFAGPALGGIISVIFLVAGLLLSHPGSLFQVPTEFFRGSIFVGTLARVVLGSTLKATLVDVHPLTVIGWLGLVITALNLLPAGQLDGGRILLAIYGRKTARRATVATLIAIGVVALINPSNPIPLYWGIIILFLQRELERPSLNELTEPDDIRAALGLVALFLMLLILIPLNPGLAGRLGIGG